jgi:NAD(P)H-quinone oxidoreductase subunit 6
MDNLASFAEINSVSIETWMFYILAAMAIPFAFGVILDKAIIRSGFLLIGVFGAISGLFLILQAQFIAMAQIMIYAVGITLVVVIALMLTNPRMDLDLKPTASNGKLTGFVVSFVLFAVIYMAIRSETWPIRPEVPAVTNVAVIGGAITGQYALPFEFASVLLLAALMGAIMLAKNEPVEPEILEYSEPTGSASDADAEALTTAR